MDNFVEAIDIEKLPPGRSTTVTIGDTVIALYNVDGAVYATADGCAHAGSSLGWGKLDGKIITCRAHGMRYDVTTGKVVGNADVGVQSYPAKIEGGKVLVAVD